MIAQPRGFERLLLEMFVEIFLEEGIQFGVFGGVGQGREAAGIKASSARLSLICFDALIVDSSQIRKAAEVCRSPERFARHQRVKRARSDLIAARPP